MNDDTMNHFDENLENKSSFGTGCARAFHLVGLSLGAACDGLRWESSGDVAFDC